MTTTAIGTAWRALPDRGNCVGTTSCGAQVFVADLSDSALAWAGFVHTRLLVMVAEYIPTHAARMVLAERTAAAAHAGQTDRWCLSAPD